MEADKTIYFFATQAQNAENSHYSMWQLVVLQRRGCEIRYILPDQQNEGDCKQNLKFQNKSYVFIAKN
jgi:ferric iron reductase protein FhuF